MTLFFHEALDKASFTEDLLLFSLVLDLFWLFLLLFKSSLIAISAPASCSSFSSPAVSRLPRVLNEGGLLPRGPLTCPLTPLVHLSKYFTSLDSCENLTTAHFPLSTKVIRDLNHNNGHTDRSLEDLEYLLTSSLGNSILSLMMKQLLTNN